MYIYIFIYFKAKKCSRQYWYSLLTKYKIQNTKCIYVFASALEKKACKITIGRKKIPFKSDPGRYISGIFFFFWKSLPISTITIFRPVPSSGSALPNSDFVFEGCYVACTILRDVLKGTTKSLHCFKVCCSLNFPSSFSILSFSHPWPCVVCKI